jgi:UDP-N-acetylglucosamine 2-epimerase
MPEELHRLVADHCADRLYAPTPQAMKNLENENLAKRSILSGDVMLDAVQHNIELAKKKSRVLQALHLEPGEFGLVTIHRAANTTGEQLQKLLLALDETANTQIPLIFSVHPRTRAVLAEIGHQTSERLRLIEPLPYLDSISLIQAAAVVLTDSGGVQKEAAFLHTPCLTMRSETEWTETIEIGINRLVGNAALELAEEVSKALKSQDMFNKETINQLQRHYGNGDAAMRIVNDCIEWIS